jgi:hypothetical protein
MFGNAAELLESSRFPFLLGSIAVSLIAAGGEWSAGEASTHRKWRRLVRVLMSLHFDEHQEH